MREIFNKHEQINKAFELPINLQKIIDSQKKNLISSPNFINPTSSLFFPQSLLSPRYSLYQNLVTRYNFSTLLSLSQKIAKSDLYFQKSYLTDHITRQNIQRHLNLLSADIRAELVEDAIQAAQELNTSEEIKTEVTTYFNELEEFDTSAQKSEGKSLAATIAMIIIIYLIHSFNDQLQMTIFEYATKPLITYYLSSKEVKSIVKNEIKKNELSTLYGKRISLTDLNLRDLPKQSSTLLETIEAGKILYIIDEPCLHKSWLKVEVEYNGEKIQGYVLRRYTTIIKP